MKIKRFMPVVRILNDATHDFLTDNNLVLFRHRIGAAKRNCGEGILLELLKIEKG